MGNQPFHEYSFFLDNLKKITTLCDDSLAAVEPKNIIPIMCAIFAGQSSTIAAPQPLSCPILSFAPTANPNSPTKTTG
jgi:hypothetical protein